MVRPADLARTLVRRNELARSDDRADAVRATLREALRSAPAPRPTRAWLIGSLAWGGFGEGSDVDVVVEGLDVERTSALTVHLVRALPVMPEVLRIEELPEGFRERVLAEGAPLDVTR